MNTEPAVAVRNARDGRQVRTAQELDQQELEAHQDAVRVVLSTPAGRRCVYEWCVGLGLFSSVFSNSSQIYHQAGKQDAARKLWQECEDASLELVELMHREALARQKLLAAERQALQKRERR